MLCVFLLSRRPVMWLELAVLTCAVGGKSTYSDDGYLLDAIGGAAGLVFGILPCHSCVSGEGLGMESVLIVLNGRHERSHGWQTSRSFKK